MNYEDFIKTKQRDIIKSGFEVKEKLNGYAFPFQDFIIRRAVKAGKYAIFANTGLGKTFMQLEWARIVKEYTGKDILILAPLAVTDQTKEEAGKFGISLDGIYITNYEQMDNLNPDDYIGIVLDESGILKNNEGKIRTRIIQKFKKTPYKLACTATPSPNDPEELGNHAEFLDVMSYHEMLAMYFVHDAGDTGNWRLKKHAVKSFYQFVSSWSIMLNDPADIGFPMEGYDLPPLNLIEKKITTPMRDGVLVNESVVSATEFNAELRRTMDQRLDEVIKIVETDKTTPWIIWIRHDEEGKRLRKAIPEAIEVKGSDKPEIKKKNLLGFAHGDFRILITKKKIAKFGMNYQNCHNQIHASLDFSFEGLYQAIRRSYRFGQEHAVNVYMITTDTMVNVIGSIKRKEENFKMMQAEMSKAVNANLNNNIMVSAEYNTDPVENESYSIKRGDSIKLIKEIPDNSIDFSVFSPPFADLFVYSSHVEDMGNCSDFDQFVQQFKFLVKELYRIIKTGRNVSIHCMDLPIQKGKEGFIGLRDFSGMIREAMEEVGFIYHDRITIWKNPVTEMQRTKALGLLHKQIKKDSTMCRTGIPDTIMTFRKDGERLEPVKHYGNYNELFQAVKSNEDLDKSIEELKILDVDTWQQYASPVWMDIDQGDTLNFRAARAEEDEKHLCPLQLPVVKRLIHLYTNPGDTVFTPFLGISTEVYQAVKMGRKGKGFELKESYYSQAKKNLDDLMEELKQGELF